MRYRSRAGWQANAVANHITELEQARKLVENYWGQSTNSATHRRLFLAESSPTDPQTTYLESPTPRPPHPMFTL